jgi:hypothetical protein
LTPALAASEGQLQASLEEVCEETVVQNANTDELIRIDEALAEASDAAKQAISLRRRIRADESDDLPPSLNAT